MLLLKCVYVCTCFCLVVSRAFISTTLLCVFNGTPRMSPIYTSKHAPYWQTYGHNTRVPAMAEAACRSLMRSEANIANHAHNISEWVCVSALCANTTESIWAHCLGFWDGKNPLFSIGLVESIGERDPFLKCVQLISTYCMGGSSWRANIYYTLGMGCFAIVIKEWKVIT